MGLFNPIKGQYERLRHALGSSKTLHVSTVAASMRVRRERVEKNLAVMTRRRYFGANKPYMDNELQLMVIDRRYADYAATLGALDRLLRALRTAKEGQQRRARADAQAQREERARTVGAFVRDVVDGAMNGGAGQVFKARAGGFVRDLIAPAPAASADPEDQSAEQAIALLTASARGMRDYLLAHPEEKYIAEDIAYLQSLCRLLDTYAGYLAAPEHATQAARRTEKQLLEDCAPELNRRLDAWLSLTDAMPLGDDDPLLRELDEACDALRALGRRARGERVREGMAKVNAALFDILSQLKADPACRGSAAVRSLKACYLPVTSELLEKYVQYESRGARDEATLSAMDKAAHMLESDVPAALRQLLGTLRAGQAIDLEAQTAALENKLRLDGLLKPSAAPGAR